MQKSSFVSGLVVILASVWSLVGFAATPKVVVVAPLCKATEAWNQAGALNDYVHLGMGYPCGCDPLAWGQVVTYHGLVTGFPAADWKPTPTQGKVYLCESNGAFYEETRTTLPGTYNWADIRDQGAGVSRLMRDLGTLGNTWYRPGGTSGTFGAANAVAYFGYKNGGYKFTQPVYSKDNVPTLQENWEDLIASQIRGSLHAGAPMVTSVINNAGGHAIVCDGYGYAEDGTLLFHFHYGWGTGSDRWEPLSWFSYHSTEFTSTFKFQTITFNTHPNELGCVLAGRVSRGGIGIKDITVTLMVGNQTQTATTDANGGYVFTGLAEKTEISVTVDGALVETQTVTTGRFLDDDARQKAQDEYEETVGKGYYVPLEGGNVVADFELPVPTVYVTASGTGDGSSWEKSAPLSSTTLSNLVAGTEVRVASGAYTVTEILTVPAGVTVKGSYDASTNTQDIYATPTTITMGTGAYGYPPVFIFDIDATGVIDRFVLENSQDWPNFSVNGGTVKNCIFTGTFENVAQDATLQCCIMRNASATQEGCSLIHCTFYGDIPIGKEGATGTMAGNIGNITADYPSTSGGCTCGLCPQNGLDGRSLLQTHGALAPKTSEGYSLRLR